MFNVLLWYGLKNKLRNHHEITLSKAYDLKSTSDKKKKKTTREFKCPTLPMLGESKWDKIPREESDLAENEVLVWLVWLANVSRLTTWSLDNLRASFLRLRLV